MVLLGVQARIHYADVEAKSNDKKHASEVDYGIDCDDEEWRHMRPKERHEAIELPIEFVDSLSTDELLTWALEYPLLSEGIFFDYPNDRLEFFSRVSYVFKALFDRNDVADIIIERYKDFVENGHVENIKEDKDAYSEYLIKSLFFISYLEVNYSEFSENQLKRLSSLPGFEYSCFEGNENPSRSYTPGFTNVGQMATFNGAHYYIGFYGKYNVTSPCFMYSYGDLSPTEVARWTSIIETYYPLLNQTSDPTVQFNCHSYAWIQNSPNVYWYTSVSDFANSSSFTKVGENCATVIGDKVIIKDSYDNIMHSAIITTTSNTPGTSMTISKCGVAGICTAYLGDLIYYYGNTYDVYR